MLLATLSCSLCVFLQRGFLTAECHEEEFESSKTLEAPCACFVTIKFADRDCIHAWCNEKGNTTCEIWLLIRRTYIKIS
ncbi:hypothetical protein VNO78_14834 [Psophocarpus tetragonolobus]|uniref:RING-CH-type domain-containing protein n=1 Tax=Psophocarpus tetragonolobus TaxID=3891 RepID=A0AAN9SDS7_PSOTE